MLLQFLQYSIPIFFFQNILENIHGQGTPGTPRSCAAAVFILENTQIQIDGTNIEHHLKSLSPTFEGYFDKMVMHRWLY